MCRWHHPLCIRAEAPLVENNWLLKDSWSSRNRIKSVQVPVLEEVGWDCWMPCRRVVTHTFVSTKQRTLPWRFSIYHLAEKSNYAADATSRQPSKRINDFADDTFRSLYSWWPWWSRDIKHRGNIGWCVNYSPYLGQMYKRELLLMPCSIISHTWLNMVFNPNEMTVRSRWCNRSCIIMPTWQLEQSGKTKKWMSTYASSWPILKESTSLLFLNNAFLLELID